MAAMRTPPVIAIVGAGYCGVVAASLLLRSGLPAGVRIVLLERPGHGIGGVAYDVSSDQLLLNVRAERMSAFEHDRADFVNFLAEAEPTASATSFVSRRRYGRYLAARLDAAAFADDQRCRLEPVAAEVIDVRRDASGRWELLADAGVRQLSIVADAVLLATGGSIPAPPRWLEQWMIDESRYTNAWSPPTPLPAGTDAVVAIGTGLTLVDLVVELRTSGFKGRIVAISRHGRLPRVDGRPAAGTEPADLPDEIRTGKALTTRRLMRALVRHARALAQRGRDYRTMLAAIRPHSTQLWAALDQNERARFLRHVRAIWDVHRHRMPDVSAALIDAELKAGTLEIIAGRVLDVGRSATGLTLTIRRRGQDDFEAVHAGRIVNCTGAPAGAPLGNPWAALLGRGAASRDGLGIGVLTDTDGRLLDAGGRPTDGLHYAGPLWRAQSWETTAVPELRARLPAVVAAIVAGVVRQGELA